MFRIALLMMLAASPFAAEAVDIDTARKDLPGRRDARTSARRRWRRCRRTCARCSGRYVAAKLSAEQLAAVSAAAERGFRIDVFEPPALSALAANLDPGHRQEDARVPRRARLAGAWSRPTWPMAALDEQSIDRVMNGRLTAPSTPKRDALIERSGACRQIDRVHRGDFPLHGPGGRHRHGDRLRPGTPAAVAERARNPARPRVRTWR